MKTVSRGCRMRPKGLKMKAEGVLAKGAASPTS